MNSEQTIKAAKALNPNAAPAPRQVAQADAAATLIITTALGKTERHYATLADAQEAKAIQERRLHRINRPARRLGQSEIRRYFEIKTH